MNDDCEKENGPLKTMETRYRRYLKLERGASVNTIDAYGHDLKIFLQYLAEEKKWVLDVTLDDLQHFAAGLHETVGPRSQCRVLSGVRSFFRFLVLDGYIEQDPSELLESPVIPDHLPEYLTPAEVDLLEDSLPPDKAESQRNRAIIEVLFSCGLRVSELVNLQLSQLYIEERYVRVWGKGSKERLVPLSDRAVAELQDCSHILHAGDIVRESDLDELRLYGSIYAVRGNNDLWQSGLSDLAGVLWFEIAGVKFVMTHDRYDVPRNLDGVQAVIFGHSHRYSEVWTDGRLWLNPGSCGRARFGGDVTMAKLELQNGKILRVRRIDFE